MIHCKGSEDRNAKKYIRHYYLPIPKIALTITNSSLGKFSSNNSKIVKDQNKQRHNATQLTYK